VKRAARCIQAITTSGLKSLQGAAEARPGQQIKRAAKGQFHRLQACHRAAVPRAPHHAG
jgi:hypothetical protein